MPSSPRSRDTDESRGRDFAREHGLSFVRDPLELATWPGLGAVVASLPPDPHRELVISDLAPAPSGISVTDTSRSIELARRSLEVALAVLKKGGHFLCKVFEGPDVKAFRTELAGHFARVQAHRPSAVRKASREIYLLALDRSPRVASSGAK